MWIWKIIILLKTLIEIIINEGFIRLKRKEISNINKYENVRNKLKGSSVKFRW